MDYNYNRLMFGPSKPLEYVPILDKLYPSEEKVSWFKLTTDFSERMKILKDYGIISKGGKVNK